ncbi:MAG: 3-hydroxyacyl-[Bacteroidales bacterium]|nr:3-hydroxyacyl-[acyl-carrier-protein] dehydratase FabZ [Bacteroidales bacterium]
MDRQEIKHILPHREPMLLVDETVREGELVRSRYTVPRDAFFVQGHFPGHPVVPGVILCEIMAQSSVLLIPADDLKTNTAFYAGLDGVRFRSSVYPGDTVCVEARLRGRRGPAVFVEASASVDGRLCCSGKLNFMLVPNDKLNQ